MDAPLSQFPITRRWPPQYPDRIQLYSVPSPNGVKVSIALEEMGLPYEAHYVDFERQEQQSPEFLSLNPNGKIPAIVDPQGPGGRPIGLFESGAILLYLAEKAGAFLPEEPQQRYVAIQWLMFQMAAVGPIFGQLGFFHKFAGREYPDRRPFERYRDESRRLLEVLDRQLGERQWMLGDRYSIVDIACVGPVRNLVGYYGAREVVRFDELENLPSWLDRCLARPAVQRGIARPARI